MDQEQAEQEFPPLERLPERTGEGMAVVDREDQPIGTVLVVYFGGASDEAIEKAVEAEQPIPARVVEVQGSDFVADGVPEDMRARMMSHGYIKIEGPDISGIKQYIVPEQIQELVGNMVRLRVSRDELLNG